jgi:NAD(P)-dependent dehydrogenase (short-subunit alcohol dehydrogenase family)
VQSVVVTGVSTGIGWGIAKVMTAKAFRVFGSVRKQADAERLRAELGERFSPLIFDVTDAAAIARAAAEVRAALGGGRLWGLVNNAGIAVAGPLLEASADEFRQQLEVNLIAPMVVIKAFAPLLGTDRTLTGPPGSIVNISSVGGRFAAPFVGLYAASKHGLEGLSDSLRRELMLYGIDVIIVAPGSVATPIWDKAEQIDLAPYQTSPYFEIIKRFRDYMIAEGRKGWSPERLGEVVCEALTAARPKARYSPVAGRFQNWTLPRMLPVRIVDRIIARTFGIRPS